MFRPGDVISLRSDVAGKRKFHICISINNCFLFLNSPKVRVYPGDLVVDCQEFPFLPTTSTGKSIISCSLVLRYDDAEIRRMRPERLGAASHRVLRLILSEVEGSDVLSEAEKAAVLEGLGDFL